MGLPFDLEDLVGVAVADVLRRVGMILGTVAGAILIGALAIGMGELAVSLIEYGRIGSVVWESAFSRGIWLGAAPLGSGWGLLYGPLLLALGLYFKFADAPGVRSFAIGMASLSLLYVLSAGAPGWFRPTFYGVPMGGGVGDPDRLLLILKSIAVVLWLGFSGAIGFLAYWLERRGRAKAEEHLVGVTIENERRRQELREKHGIVIADREYAVDEELPS